MKVLQVVEATFAGVGRHVLDLSVELVDLGVDVELVYSPRRADASFLDRVDHVGFSEITRLPDSTTQLAGTRRALAAVRERSCREVDVVHGHSSLGGAWARLGSGTSTPVVYTPNAFATQSPSTSPAVRAAYLFAERAMARRTTGYIAVSPEEHQHAVDLRLRFPHTTVIPNGIPPSSSQLTRAEAREQLGVAPRGLLVGFVGRLAAQKGVDVLLRATRDINDSTGATVAVVGTGPDGPALRQLAADLGIEQHVRWLGYHEGRPIMSAFDVLVLPSRYEGFPYVALEALDAGTPIVASHQSNTSLLLGDGRAGLIVEGTAAALSAAVCSVLLEDSLRRSMSAAGPDISAAHDTRTMSRHTLSFYEQLLAGGS